MIFIFELLIVNAQLSLFPIEGQSFYYGLGQKSQGFMVIIDGEALGFKIYNGISGSRIHNMEFSQCKKIISTSIYENGNQIALSCLTQENDYQIQLNFLGYDQKIKLSDTYNISNTLNCTSFIIFDDMNLLTNCFNEFGQVIYIITKNGVSKSIITSIKINLESLQKISWQMYLKDQINIYATYIHYNNSIIYLLKIKDSDIKSITKFWKYEKQFIQIHITYADQVFALSQSKLMYSFKNTTLFVKNTQKKSYISMDVYQVRKNQYQVVLCDQDTIYLYRFISKFYFIGITQFNIPITQASLYVDQINLFVVNDQQMLYYDLGQQNTAFRLIYFQNTQAYSDLNLFNFLSQYLITFNKTQYQLFQIKAPYIYCESPQKSGDLKLLLHNPENNAIQIRTLSIQVQQPQNFWQFLYKSGVQIINGTIQGYEYFRVDLDLFIGPNQTFSLDSNDMFYQEFQQPVLVQTFNASYIISHSIIDLKSFLTVIYQKDQITICLYQYDFQTNQISNIWQQNFNFYNKILGMSIVNDVNNTDLIKLCIVTPDILYIFYIYPLIEVKLYQTFDLIQLFNQSEQTYLNQLNILQYIFIIYTNKIFIIRLGIEIEPYSQIFLDNITFVVTNYKKVVIIENQTLMFYQNNILELKPIIQYRPKNLNKNDLLYVFPTYYGSFILFGQQKNWNLQFIDEECIKQTIVGQLLLQDINIEGYDFSQQIFAYTVVHFYAVVWYEGQQYLNIYRQSYHQQNFLYQSIYINNKWINSIEVSKDLYFSNEYVTIMFKNNQVQLYIIPITQELKIYPKFILQSQYDIQSQIQLQNQFSQLNISLQVSAQQQYLQLEAEKNIENINASIQQDININLSQIFQGAIQNYSLECENCLDFSYESIVNQKNIINGSFDQINSKRIEAIQYLYLGQSKFLNQYEIDVEKQNSLQAGVLQQQYQAPDQLLIIYSFIEQNMQLISWIIWDGANFHLNTIIKNIQQNLTLRIEGQIKSINYKDGLLQIGTINSYYCYTYLIIEQKQQLHPLLNLRIQQLKQFQNPFIQLFRNLTQIKFGTILQTSASSLILILIDANITEVNYILNDFSIIWDFNQYLCKECIIHSIIQVGQPIDLKKYDLLGILLLFTTDIIGRGFHIMFENLLVHSTFDDYQLVMINSTKLNRFHNIIVTNGEGKIVILNSNKENINQINFINFYNIATNYNQHQIIYPYYYINTSSQFLFDGQLQYINSNQLVICQNEMVQFIQQQSYMKITYDLNKNATLRLIAQNQYSRVSYLINLQFDLNQPPSPTNPITKYISNYWYWILIIIISLFILLILVKLIKFIKQIRQEQYRRVEEIGIEIRIKTQNDY